MLPESLVFVSPQELIDHKLYAAELLRSMPKVMEKAESVVANVKRKGAAAGPPPFSPSFVTLFSFRQHLFGGGSCHECG